ncbi:PREDICTED: transmembrane protein 11 homolog, mitochondrial [Nicrophorus vespilloides]|uniref:Transmembrane protein 11 homolog, mitochondrial n=1 Tax=Nicrophorus vespilloides TaxID=110193 RepID=A0ABM1NHL5_NICVS|nr:PREDICTED: transmembrane protein 11 homolog, mitochondrial [Nicrophorus vespilloides]
MDAGGDRALHSSNEAVIREVYDSEFAHQTFAMELERALDARCCVIVIEPTQLGDETARWISVGNCLHKTAVLTGLGAIISGIIWQENPIICTPMGVISVLSTGLYTASWQFDNCVKYQVERDPRKLARLPVLSAMSAASPVVLVRKDDTKRKILHWTVSLSAAAICTFRLYKSIK